MGGELGGEWIHVYVWLSLFAGHLKLSQHCSLAILQYKMLKKNKSTENATPSLESPHPNQAGPGHIRPAQDPPQQTIFALDLPIQ